MGKNGPSTQMNWNQNAHFLD